MITPEIDLPPLDHCRRAIREMGPHSILAQAAFRDVFEQWYPLIHDLAAKLGGGLRQGEVRRAAALGLWQLLCRAEETPARPAILVAVLVAQAHERCLSEALHGAAVLAGARSGATVVEQQAPRDRRLIDLVEQLSTISPAALPVQLAGGERLSQQLRQLPAGLQDCVVCRRLLGLSAADTAALLRLTTAQVERRTARAHRILLQIASQ